MSLSAQKTVPLSVKVSAHFETMRPYTVIWSGLVSLAGGCIAYGDLPPFRIAFLVFIIPMLGWTAGLYLSDYLDRKLDAIEKPHRPIPSGRIQPNEALMIGGLFAILGLGLSFLLTVNNILLVFIVALLVLLYARYTKSRGFLGNFTRGLVTVAAYFYGVVGAGIDISNIPLQLGVLSFVFLLHDTASNLVGSIRDIEGDRKGGYQTVPVRWGIKISVIIAFILTLSYLIILTWLVWVEHILAFPLRFTIVFAVVIVLLAWVYSIVARSIQHIDRRVALRAHEFYIAERITLAAALVFGMISELMIAIIFFTIAIVITLLSQYILRLRYEFVPEL